MKNIELLAPAGSYEALVAAIENGADAIYLGGNEFSARAFATNFDRKELEKAVNYSHLRNVKIYVTVNTLYSDDQFLQLHDYLVFLAKINVDALIIQDMGLLNYVLEHFPNFEIHLSTQASIHDLPGVEFFKNKGIKRIVLARENSLDEIKSICNQTDLDIEVFVHGALCMSYSGQCLMSSMIAKRSGNKGACGQPCRLAYQLEKDDQILNQKPLYLLSPRDLCTIESIDLLIEAGITSFKIEGRMKRPEYVAIVVKQYRDAIDAYLNKKQLNDIEQRILKMKKMFNRNFTGGYLLKDRQFMARDLPGNQGIKVAKVIGYNKAKKLVKLQLTDQLKQGDRINFVDLELTRTITKLYHQRKLVNQAKNGDIVEIELNQIPKLQSFAYKLYDIDLIQEAKA
ncbi:peptidase U32 family protein, partial [Thomasclavelia sp.]|uniref:peptidase U32 family protein n=1 Tax=Thomasclavelia sp. TaxID=3025757 RepID=UPI0025D9E657